MATGPSKPLSGRPNLREVRPQARAAPENLGTRNIAEDETGGGISLGYLLAFFALSAVPSTPATVIGTVEAHRRPPKRVPNAEVRAREYLTDAEVDRLIKAAGANRNGHRDATMVLVAYRHGLRPVELVTLRWDAIDFAHGQIHVSRAKNGAPSVHPLSGVELWALRRLKRDLPDLCQEVVLARNGLQR